MTQWAQGKSLQFCTACKTQITSMVLLPEGTPYCGGCWTVLEADREADAEIEKKKCQMDAQSLKDEREYEREEIERFDW